MRRPTTAAPHHQVSANLYPTTRACQTPTADMRAGASGAAHGQPPCHVLATCRAPASQAHTNLAVPSTHHSRMLCAVHIGSQRRCTGDRRSLEPAAHQHCNTAVRMTHEYTWPE